MAFLACVAFNLPLSLRFLAFQMVSFMVYEKIDYKPNMEVRE